MRGVGGIAGELRWRLTEGNEENLRKWGEMWEEKCEGKCGGCKWKLGVGSRGKW